MMEPRWLYALLFGTQALASVAKLPSYPLAVKSPYLSTWLPSTGVQDVANAQPEFWTGQKLNWPVLARVDGKTYALLNAPSGFTDRLTAAKTLNVSYSSTHTWITLAAGNVNFTLDFFSPVYPRNLTLQSLPYSYLTVNVATKEPRNVQVFSAIDQTWTNQNGAAKITYASTKSTGFFRFYNEKQTHYAEINDMAAWEAVIFGTSNSAKVTHASGPASDVYAAFVSNGGLVSITSNESGSNIAAIARDLGQVGGNGASVTFAVGFQRDLAVKYLGKDQTGYHRTLWWTIEDAFEFFVTNYNHAHAFAKKLDRQIRSKAESVSGDWGGHYADICEASVRQCFAAYELTVGTSNSYE
jgi:uncharacterized protein (DUF608 family)